MKHRLVKKLTGLGYQVAYACAGNRVGLFLGCISRELAGQSSTPAFPHLAPSLPESELRDETHFRFGKNVPSSTIRSP
jgi:hypothetical protein